MMRRMMVRKVMMVKLSPKPQKKSAFEDVCGETVFIWSKRSPVCSLHFASSSSTLPAFPAETGISVSALWLAPGRVTPTASFDKAHLQLVILRNESYTHGVTANLRSELDGQRLLCFPLELADRLWRASESCANLYVYFEIISYKQLYI